ncbi:hypothetical protein [Streptomyces sp. NPDC051286]|uniref:hypothetical protein n=1 Tax=Streptomyces sp. NPDC051286 TaxID=3365647 RepID=UPI0037ADD677
MGRSQPHRKDPHRPRLPAHDHQLRLRCADRRGRRADREVWLNGFLLGRLRTEQGPQRTLYAPAPLWHAGANEVLVLDLTGAAAPLTVELRAQPDLGPIAPAPQY